MPAFQTASVMVSQQKHPEPVSDNLKFVIVQPQPLFAVTKSLQLKFGLLCQIIGLNSSSVNDLVTEENLHF